MTATLEPAQALKPDTVTMAGALNRALADALAEDERVLVFGEDVGTLGGVFRVTDGLAARFGEKRVFDTPLAESGIVGTAIGMAMNGLRPVVEMQFDAFAYPAFEQITSHLAKLRNRTRGAVELPIVIRRSASPAASSNRSSASTWLARAPGMFHPVTVRVVPPYAAPCSTSCSAVGETVAEPAKSRSTKTVPFQSSGIRKR